MSFKYFCSVLRSCLESRVSFYYPLGRDRTRSSKYLLLISFNKQEIVIKKIPLVLSILIGSIIGFISGLVGIGGGIFLSPILFLMKAGLPKHITSTASLFILVNSIFGIGGQLTKDIVFNEFLNYWPLFIAVLIGGQIGSFLNIKFLSNKILALLTACLVIFVAIRMGITLIA